MKKRIVDGEGKIDKAKFYYTEERFCTEKVERSFLWMRGGKFCTMPQHLII